MTASDDWEWISRYEHRSGDDDLRQGDLIVVSGTAVEQYFRRSGHLVVLNQSCDLARQNEFSRDFPIFVSRARTLLAAPVVRVQDFFAAELRRGKKLSKVARFRQALWWNHALYAYLPPSPEHDLDQHLLVVLEELYTLELWHIANGIPNLDRYAEMLRSPRVGIASPWAERLGWMVGSMFARVGTPDPSEERRRQLEDQIATDLAQPTTSSPTTVPPA